MAHAKRIVAVTGGASGLGAEVARRFAADGAALAIVDRQAELAQDVADSLNRAGAQAVAVAADVSDPDSVAAAMRMITQALGAPDVLVNSAGIAAVCGFLETEVELFDRMTAINIRGTLLFGQLAARAMIESRKGGSILNLASASGRRGNAGRGAYGPSKGAVVAMTKAMAVELAPHGIRVNAIAPGPIETPLAKTALDAASRATWEAAVPLGRYGQPGEIAAAAVYLASDEAAYVTGVTLDVDGGFFGAGLLRP